MGTHDILNTVIVGRIIGTRVQGWIRVPGRVVEFVLWVFSWFLVVGKI